jgi:hypothetical protein
MPERLRQAAGSPARLGLHRAGAATTTPAGLLGPDPPEEAVHAWVGAYPRVSVAAERR